jgi:starch-binding outer membrane protein SusE/F
MKKILKPLIFSSLLLALFAACKKDENKVILEGATSPVLTPSITTPNLPLSFANKDKEALKLSWTNPNYTFNTGVSSQDVTYQIEIDTAGVNFTGKKKQTVSVSKELSKSFNVAEFNGFLLNQLVLDTSRPHSIEIRVKSTLANAAAPIYSNVLKYTVVPYPIPPVVAPPTTGELFLVGDATNGGWNNPVPLPSQKFTKIDALHFEITVPLIGGKEYLFLPLNGDWGHKYAAKDKSKQSADGGDFGYDFGDNFPGPAASGNYKIVVDFQRGKYSVTKL